MTFLEKIKPHLISDDILIQETVLHALHDYPNVPEEWTVALLKEAFKNKEKQSSILIYVEKQTINEEAVQILLENLPKMDQSGNHLAINLLDHLEPELALKYMEPLKRYINEDTWALYKLILHGSKEVIYEEYAKTINTLDRADSFQHDLFIKAKKLAKCLVQNNWITPEEIASVIEDELKEQWFSFSGILSVYMIGLLKLSQFIPVLADLLVRDDDILLEEAAFALIGFQNDDVVKEVAPYLKKPESIIFATSVVENIKTELAVKVLREAYRAAEELGDQDLLIEALCHQLSKAALPEISTHMENEYLSGMVDIEQVVYSYYSILEEQHPELEEWKHAAFESEMDYRNAQEQTNLLQSLPIRNENQVGRNDPCPCGSGKKYKKCCGK
ncbi:SEC-C metal-binding domain-containing protein [Neobacillus sp. WH10]|uniref:SEC-C metal-binding domain-containing protein n=1 Tax=Neobacillus sp. WH10 TaxID=3047873 RepID=UPI0024C14CD0|nr:SEC-C metal-binding domain-containing protein [Neobacillus sp. WH10]WHY79926.1 SEC-C metal-binding domain-containing protein [Neobacillus sp. WH10]